MTAISMKPVRFDRCQVRLMVRAARYFHPEFADRAGELPEFIRQVIKGEMEPSPALLAYFGLIARGKGYIWNPR